MFRSALAAAMVVSVASVGVNCKSTLESMAALSETEVAARCRAAFSPGVCVAARRSLGAQPWSSERILQTCSGFAAAIDSDTSTLERALEEKTPSTPVDESASAKHPPAIEVATTEPPADDVSLRLLVDDEKGANATEDETNETPGAEEGANATEEEANETPGAEAGAKAIEDEANETPGAEEGAKATEDEANETPEVGAKAIEGEANEAPGAAKLYQTFGGKPLKQDGSFSLAAGSTFAFVCFVGAAWFITRRRAAGSNEEVLLYSGELE